MLSGKPGRSGSLGPEDKEETPRRIIQATDGVLFCGIHQLFFSEISQVIDLSSVTFLKQEVFTDIKVKEKHYVDIIVETRLKGEPGLILIHMEHQAQVQEEFNKRMFVYFSRLYQTHRLRILPIAVFTHDKIRNEPDSFELGFSFMDVLRFQFYKLELKKHNWRDYIESNNPVAAALLCKMNFTEAEKVKVKLEFLRMLARMRIDPARSEVAATYFETYVKLTKQEQAALDQELAKINKKEAELIMEITTSWHEKGRKEGRKEEKTETAKRMLMRNMEIDDILEVTRLKVDEIEKLKKQVSH